MIINFSDFLNESTQKKDKYYKVVTHDMKSLGLRKNPNVMTFPINKWIYEPKDRISYDDSDLGGIWVAQTLSGAKGLLKYLKKKSIKENNPDIAKARIFEVEIGNILYQNSYRVKTDKVKFLKEIKIDNIIKENINTRETDFDFYLNQINDPNKWNPITDELFYMIENEGWVEELTSEIDDNDYLSIRDNIKNNFIYKELNLLNIDKNGIIEGEESSIEFFNELDILLKSDQDYPYNTLDFIDYDKGKVYIIKYKNS